MSRPVGSKNKPKVAKGSGVFLTNLEKQIEGSAITRKNALGWVNWGIRNNYPNLLLDLYNQSPTHRSAVNFAVQSILGNGVDYNKIIHQKQPEDGKAGVSYNYISYQQ